MAATPRHHHGQRRARPRSFSRATQLAPLPTNSTARRGHLTPRVAIARFAAGVYYRIRYGGEPVPPAGPALLVANHPNALLDPIIVLAAAGRPVRFLAKATLFSDPKTAWFVRLGQAIPVHRTSDAPDRMADNAAMFRAVHEALARGDAVGLFPEGLSHAEPALAPLRTGAARMALGAATVRGGGFPVIPIGLTLRERDVFRSHARVVVGPPVDWDDLALCGVDDPAAVRALTSRIAEALGSITLNLERWEDEPLVDCAVRVWEAERRVRPNAAERADRLAIITRILASGRATDNADTAAAVLATAAHQRRLARLGLRPADLTRDTTWWWGTVRAARIIPLLLALWATLGVAGWLLFVIPYQLTGQIAGRFGRETDTRSTWKFLVGALLYLAWVLGLAVVAGWIGTVWAGLAALVLIPVVGMAGLRVRELWRGTWADVRRFGFIRSQHSLLDELRAAQRDLAARFDNLYQRHHAEASS